MPKGYTKKLTEADKNYILENLEKESTLIISQKLGFTYKKIKDFISENKPKDTYELKKEFAKKINCDSVCEAIGKLGLNQFNKLFNNQ